MRPITKLAGVACLITAVASTGTARAQVGVGTPAAPNISGAGTGMSAPSTIQSHTPGLTTPGSVQGSGSLNTPGLAPALGNPGMGAPGIPNNAATTPPGLVAGPAIGVTPHVAPPAAGVAPRPR